MQTHQNSNEVRGIRGLSLHEGMEKQTHQQFMDDTMLMGHPSVQEARAFKRSLTLFSKASGLAVNAAKYQVFFLNTTPITQTNIVRIWGFTKGSVPSKFLRVPLGKGIIRNTSWQDLIDRIKGKLSSWVLKPLNLPSRLVLVKSVLQAMSVYLFFVLSAPKTIIKEI